MDLKEKFPLYLANRPVMGRRTLDVVDKYTGVVATKVALADGKTLDRAIAAASSAVAPMRALAAYERQAVLNHVVRRIGELAEDLALILTIEAGKPIKDARGEVARALDTFRIAAEEAARIGGEVLPLDISPRTKGYFGAWRRVPVGVCSFITPFNFPLNLAAHKIAPALAAGCPFVLKPASATPVSALILGEILAETSLPEGAFSILPCPREGADLLTTDERIKLVSFTGSAEVGWKLKARAGRTKVVLELGGNAACVIEPDADLDLAADRVLAGGFYQSGQSCISVQRVLVQTAVYSRFKTKILSRVKKLRRGDPRDDRTFIGPMISTREAARVEAWIQSAAAHGAKVLYGGERSGSIVEPTVLEKVPSNEPIWREEAFGPVIALARYRDLDEALDQVNASEYGLQAGVFTRNIASILKAWERLEVGGVMINESPAWRVDHMPYGGVKNSGLGREGLRFAIEDMTEIRLLVLRNL